MGNFILSKRNIADLATITASPSLVTTLPPAALQDQDRWYMARSTFAPGLASPTVPQIIRLTWTSAQAAAMFWLRMHNFSTTASIKVEHFSGAAWTGSLISSGFVTPFSTAGLDTDLDVHTDRDFRLLKNYVWYHTLQTAIRSTEITILDGANADGYVEISRLGMAKYIQPTYNPAFGSVDMVPGDASTQSPAEDGTLRTDKRYKSRSLDIKLDIIVEADMPSVLAWMRYTGLDHDFFVDLYPDETSAIALYHRGMMKLTSMDALNPHTYGLYRNSLPMKES